MFGHEPAVLLHQLLGETSAAHVLATVYLLFLPISPFSLIVFLVWSRNISYGYWYATAQCLAWAFGTASYYVLPTLGPNFAFVWLYADLDQTSVAEMQKSLNYSRTTSSTRRSHGLDPERGRLRLAARRHRPDLALITQYTVRHVWIRRAMWIYFALTVVSTLYFGWHYIADDVAGALIAVVSVWLGGLATGQKFDRHGRSSHPTTSPPGCPGRGRPARDGGPGDRDPLTGSRQRAPSGRVVRLCHHF